MSPRFEIGNAFPGELLPESEGPVLDLREDHCQLVLKLDRVRDSEAFAFRRRSAFELALYVEEEIVFLLIQIQGLCDWTDAPCSLWTMPDATHLSGPSNGAGRRLALTTLLVDGKDRLVHGVQEFELSHDFSNELLSAIETQKQHPLTPEEALKRIQSVQRTRTPEAMLAKAVAKFAP